MAFTAKDVQTLRQATGAGMMDAKKALEANDGDMEASKQWLREKGLAASAKRDDRESNQGLVALLIEGNVGAIVKLKSETDFVAGSEQFKAEADALVEARRRQGRRRGGRARAGARRPQDHAQGADRARRRRPDGGSAGQHPRQLPPHAGRPRRQRRARRDGGRRPGARARHRRAHRASPGRSTSAATTFPADIVEQERQTLETISRNEGKPEAALPKIIEGRLNGFFKDVALLDQPYAKDDKKS